MKQIAFLVQLPKYVSPGQRFRIEQFEPLLYEKGFVLETYSFINHSTYGILYKRGHHLKKIFGVFIGFLRRILFLFNAFKYDFIFLQREATPVGPPIFEWVLAKVLKKKLILDFDDAIWIPNTSEGNRLALFIKCNWKVKYLCRWSYKVSVGNQYLYDFAAKYNRNVILIPTCVDTNVRYNIFKAQSANNKVVIGWTGSHSTLPYLDIIFPVLKELENEYSFQFLVICNQPPNFQLKSMKFLPWKRDTEIDDLLKIDIGIMPLINDEWTEGKCGFKIIQYLALGIPAVASPIGVNNTIVEEGVNGFLCKTEQEWYSALSSLLENAALRAVLGQEGRSKIIKEYSIQANDNKFISLFS